MAQRIRTLENPVIDRENLSTRPGKVEVKARPPVRRAALGEVGNRLHVQQGQNGVVKKEGAVQQPSQITKKPIGGAAIKKASIPGSKTTAAGLKSQTHATAKVNKEALKPAARQDSILSHKALVQFELDSKKDQDVAYSSKQLAGIVDADASDTNDPMLVTEYIMDIFSYLRDMEVKYSIKKGFLTDSKSTPRMRCVLINWMVEVHMNFRFLQETLHLSIAILDRYLQLTPSIGRDSLQLVGTAAMLIAGKYEEIYVPELSDFVYICDDTFSKREILAMESDILKKLQFTLGRPLALHFLRRYNKVAKVKPEHHTLGKYLLEIGLLEYELCHIHPSIQAAAACCLAISILNEVTNPESIWTNTLVYYSTYKYSVIKPVVVDFAVALAKQETSKYQAIRKKYAASDLGKISAHPKLKGNLVRRLCMEASASVKK